MSSIRPEFRYKLKGVIISSGYRNVSQFCKTVGIAENNLSWIVNGWRFPSPLMQQKMREGLGISSKELFELL